MIKIRKYLTVFYTVLFMIIFCMILFIDKNIEYANKNNCDVSNIVLLIVGIIITVIVVIGYYRYFACYLQKRNKKECYFLLITANIVLFFIQLYIFKNIYFESNWDCGMLAEVSEGLAYHNYDINFGFSGDYFSRYPNNVWLTFVLTVIKKVNIWIGLETPYFATVLTGIAGVNLSVFFLTLIVNELTKDRQCSALAWIMAAVYLGLSPWCSIPYSDIFSMYFTVWIFYLYVRRNYAKYALLRWFFITLLSFIGYQIKPTVIIVWIAILIYQILSVKSKKELLKKGCQVIILSGICSLIMDYSTDMIKNNIGFIPDDNKSFSIAHYAMMGLNEATTGGFYSDDVEYSASFSSVKERTDGNIKRIKERVKGRGISENFSFFIRKLIMNYNDGSFAWAKEGDFFKTISSPPNIWISVGLRHFYYGENNVVIYNIMQMIWLIILGLNIVAGWSCLKSEAEEKSVIFLTLIGITLFVLLFEGRARYFILYSPYYIISAVIGLKYLLGKVFPADLF